MADRLLDLVYAHPELANLGAVARKEAIESLLRLEIGDERAPSEAARLMRSIDGYGPLTELLEDDGVTDVLINADDDVWIERAGRLERSDVCFQVDELDSLIQRVVGQAGGRVDPLHPITDIRLPNGDRMHVVDSPIASEGRIVSIRRFPRAAMTLDDLVFSGTIAPAQMQVLADLVDARASIVVSGATGVGKTTMLGALLSAVTDSERIVVIEETRELRQQHPHAIFLTTRDANVEGAGQVTASELVRAGLRMRPDRIVLGEVRGAEAADALWAMSTGHRGSMLTVHAAGPQHVPLILSGLAAGPSLAAVPQLEERFANAIDAFVHLERMGDRRVVTALTLA